MRLTPGELIDRYTIALLYVEREGAKRSTLRKLKKAVKKLRRQFSCVPWSLWISTIHDVNGCIWDFEAPIHTGKFDADPVVSGILSIRVRKLNVIRVNLSKFIDRSLGMS